MTEFGDELIQSLEEALAISKGEATAARVHHFPDPKEVRKQTKLTQEKMALLLNMSVSGYRKWEQGQRAVSGPALNLLRLIEKQPKLVIETLAS